MKFNKKITHTRNKDLEKVSGGKRVNFFGFESSTGSYRKCDMCNEYGAIPLSNGIDSCLNCLERLGKIIGQNNVYSLIAPSKNPQKPNPFFPWVTIKPYKKIDIKKS